MVGSLGAQPRVWHVDSEAVAVFDSDNDGSMRTLLVSGFGSVFDPETSRPELEEFSKSPGEPDT